MEQVSNDFNNKNYLDVFKPDHLMAVLPHLFLYGLSNHKVTVMVLISGYWWFSLIQILQKIIL